MITIDIHRLCKLKGIDRPHAFLTANGFSHRTASKFTDRTGKGVRYDHLEKLCRLFNGLPHDLFDYKPSGRGLNPANDVLLPLRKAPLTTKGLQSLIADLPLEEILKVSEELQARYQKPKTDP